MEFNSVYKKKKKTFVFLFPTGFAEWCAAEEKLASSASKGPGVRALQDTEGGIWERRESRAERPKAELMNLMYSSDFQTI